jgi:hypothetical protein
MTEIRIRVSDRGANLHFQWHTPRVSDLGPEINHQTMSGYDQYEAWIWLSKAELKSFENWVSENRIMHFSENYPMKHKDWTSSKILIHSLVVVFEGKRHQVVWNGDSLSTQTLSKSCKALEEMCHAIRRDRENRVAKLQ